jgi:hypothetical protein
MQEEKTFFSYFKSFLSLFVKILFLKVNRFWPYLIYVKCTLNNGPWVVAVITY